MNIDSLSIKKLVEREFMVGFASPVPFDVDIVIDGTFMDGAVLVLNVFNPSAKSPFELFVTVVVMSSSKALSVEIQNKNNLFECDIWESGNIMENISKTLSNFTKRMVSENASKKS